MSAYRRDFDEIKCISFLIKDAEQKNIMKGLSKKGFDSEPVYNEKYLKTKIKSCKGKTNKKFHNTKTPKEGSQCIFLSVILIDFVFITGKNYYPQVLLEEYC